MAEEEELVRRWQAGIDREETFRRIFHLHYPRVFRYFVTQGFSEDESRDLAQETFLRVLSGISHFRGDASFRAWLFQVASNVYRNTLRGRLTQKRVAAEIPLDSSPGLEIADTFRPGLDKVEKDALANVIAQERSKLLSEALEELPPQMRRCVELRIAQDLKYREIATLMNLKIDTVKVHLHQARKLLRQKLGDYFLSEEDP